MTDSISHDQLKKELAQQLDRAIDQTFDGHKLSANEIYSLLAPPPKSNMGHMAFGCFSLAKSLKMSPAQIAQKLAAVQFDPGCVQSASGMGPYLNFRITSKWLGDNIIASILDESFFIGPFLPRPPKCMVEYSQPNTHKEIHVGHMRNMALGQSLVALLKYCGHEVISATYPGDMGTHVAKVLWYLKNHNTDSPPSGQQKKGSWIGQMYSKANSLLEKQKGGPQEEGNRREMTKILEQIHGQKGDYYELWKETRQWSINLMEQVYEWFQIDFDRWYFESTVDQASLEYARELLKKDVLVEDQGAIGAQLDDLGLGFCIVVKSDGNGLYSTKDLELARKKFQDEHIQKNIYIVDNRQAHHFKQVFAILERAGFEHAHQCFHLAYEHVELPDGPMSSRKGNFILAAELIDDMESTIIKKHLKRYSDVWSEGEIHETAYRVAKGAISYGMLSYDPNKKIVFEKDKWLRLDGESGPYIQYAYARIQSMADKLNYDQSTQLNWEMVKEDVELDLLIQLSRFNTTIVMAATQYRPNVLANYLYDTAKMFNHFYAHCPVAKASSEALKNARLALCMATAEILKRGLKLLGINAPNRM